MRRLKTSSPPDPVNGAEASSVDPLYVLKSLLPFAWPSGRFDLRLKVVLAFVALLLAKVVTVSVPFAYKEAVNALDALYGQSEIVTLGLVPVFLIITYGMGRIMMIVFTAIRDGLFISVGQNAVRALSVETFRHLHTLSLRFHLHLRR